VAIMHLVRIINGWSVAIGPHNIPMNASWVALVVSALLALWASCKLARVAIAPDKFKRTLQKHIFVPGVTSGIGTVTLRSRCTARFGGCHEQYQKAS
jgi:hypothetical protein